MELHAIVPKVVSQAIGSFGLPREICNQLLSGIHTAIPQGYPRFRLDREPEDQDLFRVVIKIAAEERWHIFLVRANDTRAPGILFVETINYRTRPFE
jgi:hypothetical protein